MITRNGNGFALHTENTTYAFRVLETGQLEHLYYGRRMEISDFDALAEKRAFAPGNTIAYDADHPACTLEDLCLECSGYGKGDIREPFVEVFCHDGSATTDFVFEAAEILKGKEPLDGLPSAYGVETDVETLKILLKDRNHGFHLTLAYSVFSSCDVITRTAKFQNDSEHAVWLTRLMSQQLDLPDSGLRVTTFTGGWTREMNRSDTVLSAGKFVNSSFTGSSSNRANPFFMLSRPETSEAIGDCYGLNLVYSGNHYSAVEVSGSGKTRVVSGMNPAGSRFLLEPGESLQAPEAVLCYSHLGFQGMSRQMHRFVREHIVRGSWKHRARPVLLNSWEASYFAISEGSLLKLAKAGKDVGIELFVMDDGWFTGRSDDAHALGDWTPDKKKLPGGLKGLGDKLKKLGLSFGIWIEPEMVSVQSRLYKDHPDWAMAIPGMDHAEGRNQRILDLCNPEVVSHLIGVFTELLASADISYVKWDMNRIFSDVYSPYLPPNRQGEVFHRYMLGFYHLAEALTQRFPDILFEGCASGGNRFDLGMLCYFPQIWGSDNTDAVSRLTIQNGYSYGYPLSTVSAHVSSCPNHQTLRTTPLSSRFAVASFGILGYECNLCDMSRAELEEIRAQIALYKSLREVWQWGDFYRVESGQHFQWCVVSPDQDTAIGMLMQSQVQPGEMYARFRLKGLDPSKTYRFYSLPKKYSILEFGDLVNTVSPIHIRQGGLLHQLLAKVVKLDGEVEDYTLGGSALMYEGVPLKQSFVGTGYSEEVRHFPDYASRLYFLEAVNPEVSKPPAPNGQRS